MGAGGCVGDGWGMGEGGCVGTVGVGAGAGAGVGVTVTAGGSGGGSCKNVKASFNFLGGTQVHQKFNKVVDAIANS